MAKELVLKTSDAEKHCGFESYHYRQYRGVAQFGSASGLGPEGRRFESCRPDQYIGVLPSGKALEFDSSIRRFKSYYPSQYAGVAQLAEQLPCKQQVKGSSPITSSIKNEC